jgi:YHS domain-containing protein
MFDVMSRTGWDRRRATSTAVVAIAIALLAPIARAGQAAPANPRQTWNPFAETPQPVPLAVDGYCMVTLKNRRQWLPGDPQFAATFDGCEYRFVGARERNIFLAAPEKYVPVLAGDCAVTYAELSERSAGRPQHAAIRGGRLYLFSDESCLHKFMEQPARFENVDVAVGGRCVVSQRLDHRDISGIPETVAIHEGLRYYFASAHQRRLFLDDPDRYVTSNRANTTSAATSAIKMPQSKGSAPNIVDSQPSGDDKHSDQMVLDQQPLMGGYCPVTIRQHGIWIRGRYDYRVEVDDLVFLTAGPAEHDAMMGDPARFIPVLNGDCAVSLVDEGKRVRGSIFHAAEYHDRLYLFADAQHKATFKADPERYANVDVASHGECVVSKIDDKKTVLGLAEFAVWHKGRLYLFAGIEQRDKFIAAPDRYLAPLSNDEASAPPSAKP